MQYQNKITKKEKIFCFLAANGLSLTAAAKGAELDFSPDGIVRLIENEQVLLKLTEYQKALQQRSAAAMARLGLEKLAFGSVKDAVALVGAEELPSAKMLGEMDLGCISEIKRPKGGGCEIKLVDRLKALELLAELPEQEQGEVANFVAALERTAGSIKAECEENE
ncbi:MAG: terminase small subunit [Oscillospiraceae bacterium]